MSADRLAEIARLVAASRRRLSPERAYALITACEDLLDDKGARTIQDAILGGGPAKRPQEARRALARPSGRNSGLFQGQLGLFR